MKAINESGVLSFESMEKFENPYSGLSKEEINERKMAVYISFDERPLIGPEQDVRNWSRITAAILRGGEYVFESKAGQETIYVRVNPDDLRRCCFMVDRPGKRFSGSIEKVIDHVHFAEDKRLSMLLDYAVSFCLIGSDDARPHLKYVIKIGATKLRQVSDAEME